MAGERTVGKITPINRDDPFNNPLESPDPHPLNDPSRLANLVYAERKRQDAKWGGPRHDDPHEAYDWVEFVREHAEKALLATDLETRMQRFIEVAALASAAYERYERRRTICATCRNVFEAEPNERIVLCVRCGTPVTRWQ